MHIRFNRPLLGDYGQARVGDVKMVTKDVGKSLVQRGLAEEVDGPDDDEADDGKLSPAQRKAKAQAKPAPDAE